MVIAVNQVIILMVMDRVILKTLENRLKDKVGQNVQSSDIISQEFFVVLVTGLKTLTNFDVVRWLQVTNNDLLTEWEVCTGKYCLMWVFRTDRAMKERDLCD